MRADEADVHGEELVLHGDDDPILVALDVEHHAVSCEETGGRVLSLDVVGTAPLRALNLREPGEERLACVAVPVGKRPDCRAIEDAHMLKSSPFPNWEQGHAARALELE